MLWTASALKLCGYANVLGKQRKRTKGQQEALDRGDLFHRSVHNWYTHESVCCNDAEVAEWFRKLTSTWTPPVGAKFEQALGLSPNGRYIAVDEVEPHVYRAFEPIPGAVPELLTAGRADATWFEAPVVNVGDFKTGRDHLGPPELLPQLQALGFAAADLHGAEAMRLGIYYARDGVWDWSEVIALDSPKAAELWDMVVACATADETPKPGPQCGSCWERKACHAAA
jgi:hypothetical protein